MATPYTASPAVMQPTGTTSMTQDEEDAAWNAKYGQANAASGATAPYIPTAPYLGTQSMISDPPSINNPPPVTSPPITPPDQVPPGGFPGGVTGPLPPAPPPPPPPAPIGGNLPPPPPRLSQAPAEAPTLASGPPGPGGVVPIDTWSPYGGTGPTGTSQGAFDLPYGTPGTSWGVDAAGKAIPIANYTYTNPVFYGNDPASATNAAAQAYGTASQAASQQQQLAINALTGSWDAYQGAQSVQGQQADNLQRQNDLIGYTGTLSDYLTGRVDAGQANAANLQNGYGDNTYRQQMAANGTGDWLWALEGAMGQGRDQMYTGLNGQIGVAQGVGQQYADMGQLNQGYQVADRNLSVGAMQQLQALGGQLGGQANTLGQQASAIGNTNLANATTLANSATQTGLNNQSNAQTRMLTTNDIGNQNLAYAKGLGAQASQLSGVNLANANTREAGANQIGTQGLNYAYGQGANAQQMAQQGFNYGMTQGANAQQQGAQGLNYALGQAGQAQGQAGLYGQGAQTALGMSGQSRADTQTALARMQSFLDQGPGPSQAEALLKGQSDATMAQNIALARSGRGAGDNVLAQRQALFANAAGQQKLGQDMSALRANEAATWRGQKQEGLSAIQQGQAALRGQDVATAQQLAQSQLGQGQLAQQYGALGLNNQAAMGGLAQQFGQTGLQAQAQMAGLGKDYAALGQGTQLGAAQLGQQYNQSGLTSQAQMAGLGKDYAALGLGNQAQMADLGQQYMQGGLTNQAQMAGLGQQYMQAGLGNQAQMAGLGQQYAALGQGSQSGLAQAAAQGFQGARGQDISALGQAAQMQLGQNQLGQQYAQNASDAYTKMFGLESQQALGLQGNQMTQAQAFAQQQMAAAQLNQQYQGLETQFKPQIVAQAQQAMQGVGAQNQALMGQLYGQYNTDIGNAAQGLGAAQAQRSEGQQLANNILNQQVNAQLQQQSLNAQLQQQVNLGNLQTISGTAINQAQISAQQAIYSQQQEAANQAAGIGAAGTIIGGIGGALIGGPAGAVIGASAGGAAGGAISDIRAKTDIQPQSFDEFLANGAGGKSLGQANSVFAPQPGAAPPQAPAFDFRPARGYSYDYKNPNQLGAAPGRQFGPMAQDLEKTPAGAFTVGNGPTGQKFIDPNRASLAAMAGLGEQQRRLDGHEQALTKMQAFLAKNRAA
jgi:hypothetical protein